MKISKRARKQALKIYNKILEQTEDPEVLEALWELLDEDLHVVYL